MSVQGAVIGGNGSAVQVMPWKRLPTLEPKQDAQQDLGSQARKWRDVFVAGSVSFPGSGKIDTSILPANGLTIRSEEGRRAWLSIHSRQNPAQGSSGLSASIQFAESGVRYWEIITGYGSFGSSSSGDYLAVYYNDPSGTMGAGQKFKVKSTGEVVMGRAIPFFDNAYDLGAGNSRWRYGFFSSGIGVGVSSIGAKLHIVGGVGTVRIDRLDGTRMLDVNTSDFTGFGGAQGVLNLEARPADATNATRNSPAILLRGRYWNGTASANADAYIIHRVTGTYGGDVEIGFGVTPHLRINMNTGKLTTKNIEPWAQYTYDLGSETLAWRRVYAREYMVEDHRINTLNVDSLPALAVPGVLTDWLAFRPPDTVELLDASTNTWVQDTSNAYLHLFTGIWGLGNVYNITNAYNAVRFTWTSFPYRWIKVVAIELTPRDNSFNIRIETSSDGVNWTTVIYDQNVGGWPAWYIRFLDTYLSTTGKPYLRITFEINWAGAQTSVGIRRIMLYGPYDFVVRHANLPYYADVYKNIFAGGHVLPQVDNTKDLGSSTNYWRNLFLKGTIYMNNGVSIKGSTTSEYGGFGLWIQTSSGRIHVGPLNASYAHFITDRANFYFNAGVAVDGTLWPYQGGIFDLGRWDRKWNRIYTRAISVGNEYAYPFNVYNDSFYTWTAVIRGNPDRAYAGYGVLWVGNGYNMLSNVLQIYGSYIYLDEIRLYDGTNYVDATLDMREWGGTLRTLLPNTSSAIYLGRNVTFRQFYVSVEQAGAGYGLVFEYSVGTDPNTGDTLWATLTVTDGTNNLSQSGWVYFTVPSDWAKVPLQEGGVVVSSTARYWIRIRTTTAPTTAATSRFINNSGLTSNLIQAYNSGRLKFRVNIYGDILAAGRIFMGWSVAGNTTQGTYYIGQYNGQLLTNMTVRPVTDNTYDLGTSTLRWRDVWVSRTLVAGTSRVLGYSIRLSLSVGGDSDLYVAIQDGSGRANIYWDAYYDAGAGVHKRSVGDVLGANRLKIHGADGFRFYTADAGTAGSTITWTENFHIGHGFLEGRSFRPYADNTYDLGEASFRWRNAYFSGNVVIGSAASPSKKLHVYGGQGDGIMVESSADWPTISLRGFDGTSTYTTSIIGAYFGKAIQINYPFENSYLMLNTTQQATASQLIANPPRLIFRGNYYDGTTSQQYSIYIIPEITSTSPYGRIRFYFNATGNILSLGDFDGIIAYTNVRPSADSTFTLGSSSFRWFAIYARNIITGDIVLEKGWRIVEGDDGLYVLRETPEGTKKYRIVLEPVN